jgi:hypothetical protein
MAEDDEGLEALAELEREASEFNKVGKEALFSLQRGCCQRPIDCADRISSHRMRRSIVYSRPSG